MKTFPNRMLGKNFQIKSFKQFVSSVTIVSEIFKSKIYF